MDNLRDSIEILFSKTNPEKIIQHFFTDLQLLDLSEDISKEPFLVLSETLENSKTKDELEAIYNIVNNVWSNYSADKSRLNIPRKNVFFVLYNFAKEVLYEKEEKPICEFEHLLRWRDLSYKIGEDIFTTAFFAYKDLSSKRERHYFSWLPIIPTNNCHLQEILEKGISDIHFHLFGSSLNFDISWLSLMNHITGRKKEFAEIRNSKMPDCGVGTSKGLSGCREELTIPSVFFSIRSVSVQKRRLSNFSKYPSENVSIVKETLHPSGAGLI